MSHAQPLAGATDERRELSRDVMAGVVVFVVALPLCLGIAVGIAGKLLRVARHATQGACSCIGGGFGRRVAGQ